MTNIELYQGDCLEIMKTIPDKSVDLILCDLPYGTTALEWDIIIPFEPLWTEYKRLIKDKGAIVLTSVQPFTTKLIESNYDMFKYCWVWEKSRNSGIFNAKNKPLAFHEDVCVFSFGTTANKSPNRMNYYPHGLIEVNRKERCNTSGRKRAGASFSPGRPSHKDTIIQTHTNYPRSIIKIPNHNGGSVHPTQKPVELMEYLVRTYTQDGDTVMDNCMGSGTTGVACVKVGNRKFIGIEMNPEYFKIAENRILTTTQETSTVVPSFPTLDV